MGPTTLFDKSFLQSLSVDEATVFDRFFIPVVCPMFYVERLPTLKRKCVRIERPKTKLESLLRIFQKCMERRVPITLTSAAQV
jgi:hypothetical protein